MSKHTPGPLTVERQPKWPFAIVTRNANGDIVGKESAYAPSTKMKNLADFHAGVGFPYDQREEVIAANERQWADAVLRAAAPELFDVVLEMVEAQSGGYLGHAHFDKAREVIAKATGETK